MTVKTKKQRCPKCGRFMFLFRRVYGGHHESYWQCKKCFISKIDI